MSTRKTTRTATRPATGTPVEQPTAADAPSLRTDTEKTLWPVLEQHPGSTAAELADTAGVATSTARRILVLWAGLGAAHRDRDADNPRTADRWSATAGDIADPRTRGDAVSMPGSDTGAAVLPVPAGTAGASDAESGPADDETGDDVPDTAAAGSAPAAAQQETSPRLAPGALRGQVEHFLRDHPTGEFSPHEIGKALARSSGAVHNALTKLSTLGTARRTSDRPKKFTLASS